MKDERYATVDEVIEILKGASLAGHGDKVILCNGEYFLAKPGDSCEEYEGAGGDYVTLGGY